MRTRVAFLPPAALAAALAAPAAVHATTYMSVAQAQGSMFPGATFSAAPLTLTTDQVRAIERDSGVHVLTREVKAWRVSTGGWFIADEVVGKHEFITYALALDGAGVVKDVEILDYKESYGSQVRLASWRAQFEGKRHGSTLQLDRDIKNISGATLSSKHITDGVRRLLATYAVAIAPRQA